VSGDYAFPLPSPGEIYPCSPTWMPQRPSMPHQDCEREPKAKSDRALATALS
jgi:hypothetical protein